MLWHPLESQTSINSNIFRLQTSLIITACCFVISFHVIHTAQFPDVLKLADITPVFKKEDSNNVKNYRPVSVFFTGHV